MRSSGIKVTAIQVDVSAFSGPSLAPGWDPADILGGDVAPIEAVMVDAGRTQPLTPESVRSFTPALDAGRVLAAALNVDPQAVTMAAVPVHDGHQIASVQSAPLMDRLNEMMNHSDNVMAECIAREVAVATGRPASFGDAVQAVTTRLSAAGVDMTGARLMDGSGLSVDDRLTAKTLDGVIGAAAGPTQPRDEAAARRAADRRWQRHTVQPLHRRPDRRGGRLAAGQDRIADRDEHTGRRRHRRERSGADVHADVQQCRADRPDRDRRAGRHAAQLRMRLVTSAQKSHKLTVGRMVDWDFAAATGAQLARPGPPSTDYTQRQIVDELADSSRRAEVPVREVTGLAPGGQVPDALIVDRPHWVRLAADSMRVMTGGSDKPRRSPARAHHRSADRCGAGVRGVGHSGPV